MEEVRKYTVSFGYLWRIGVLDVSKTNAEVYKDETDGLWKYKFNPKSDECYENEHATQIEVYDTGTNDYGDPMSDLTNKGREQAISVFNRYGLKYNEKYFNRIGNV